ncbi:MAG: type V CRISPR-associated endonuclease Cas1 [Patescibacteria group bacterium]|nr:type V CRISPR-associated endonuclease Cas1 [Patescibacteria group bacterium]
MLTLPDFKEKQILFIQAENGLENNIKFTNDNVVYSKDGKIINRMSCHKVFAIFIIGDLTISSVLIKNALQYGISIFLLKNNFEVYATIGAKAEGNYLLRMKQYDLQNELFLSKQIVKNKISNQLVLLKNSKKITSEDYKNSKQELFYKIENAKDNNQLMGVEGNVAKNFFSFYFEELGWYKRMPRAKIDHYNILLDIGYTFIFNYIDSLLRIYGFDTYKGFYHQLFFQRKSLSCDLVEPFRCIIDKQLLKSYHLNQIKKEDFKFSNGKYLLKYSESREYAKIFLEAIMKNKEEIFCYTRDFYRFILNDKNGQKDFPIFKIK